MSAPRSQIEPNPTEERLGLVASVDEQNGTFTLRHRDGRCSDLNADASLLGDLRIGAPVLVLVEGAIVRSLRRL